MSNRPDEPHRPESRINDREGVNRSTSLSNHRQPSAISGASPPPAQLQPQNPQSNVELPPLPVAQSSAQASSTTDNYSPSTSRLAGVASILNHQPSDGSPHGRRRKAAELESNGSSSTQPLPSLTSVTQAHPTLHGESAPIAGFATNSEHEQRRILTPRSPSLQNRPTSLSQAVGPPNPSQPYYTSSPRPRGYTETSAPSHSALPTPSTAQRQSYGFPGHIPPSEVARRVGTHVGTGSTFNSTSPSTNSYSPHSQADLKSPAAQYGPTQHSMATLSSPYPAVTVAGMTSDPRSGAPQDYQRAAGVPISSAGGQNPYQMMTLETPTGLVQLPVEVQAASRVADEKRRRNAGASARFRQRRKEKEREASTNIQRLEQRLRDMEGLMQFYKQERDFFARLVMQTPGGERHFPRPPSPTVRRRSSSILDRSSASYVATHEDESRSPEEGRNTKRRTSGMMSLPPAGQLSQSAVSTPGAIFPVNYGGPIYGGHYAQQPQGQHQHIPASPGAQNSFAPSIEGPQGQHQHHIQNQLPGLPPPQMMQASPTTGPWNPFAQDRKGPPASR